MSGDDLASFKVGDISTVYYIPDYITCLEEECLLRQVTSVKSGWKQVHGRQLINYGGVVHQKGLLSAPLPSWLQKLCSRVATDTGVYNNRTPNHVLVNAYYPGEGILPHQDGPLYFPAVSILSLGSPAVMRFWKKGDDGQLPTRQLLCAVVLEPRSLLVFRDDAYETCLHGIDQVSCDVMGDDVSVVGGQVGTDGTVMRTGLRVSLTIRNVLATQRSVLRLAAGPG